MYAEFSNLFSTATGVLQILGISLIGFIFAKLGFMSRESCRSLTNIGVRFFLPCLIISNITRSFDPHQNPTWWILPLCALVMYGIAFCIGFIFFLREKPGIKGECILSCTFQNCGFLPLALIAFVCSATECGETLVFVFLFNIVFDVTVWTSSFMVLKNKSDIQKLRVPFINPPSISTLLSLMVVFIFGNDCIPSTISQPVALIGEATFPTALVMMGATLYFNRGYALDYAPSIVCSICAKLIILPLIIAFILAFVDLNPKFEFIIFLQSIMPTAVTLVLIGEYIRADNKYFSGVIFYSHIISVFTIPAWLLMYNNYIA